MARTVDGPAGGTGFAGLWASDIGPTLSLGLPIVGAQLAQIAINTTDVVMIGWLGATELAAAVLAFNLYILFWLFGMGLLHAVVPLAAKARGERKPRELRRSVRMGFWVVALYCLPVWAVLWQTEALLLLLRQDPEVSRLAGGYMRVMQWTMLTSLGVMAIRNFVSVMGRTQIVLTTTVAGAVLNGVLDYALIFGHFGAPRLMLEGAAIASVLSSAFTLVLIAVYAGTQRQLRRYAVFGRFWRSDWPAFFEILRIGWPISATLLAEVGLFASSFVLMGWIGTVPLAAHGIALQCASITFMVPLGIGQAGTIRVGLAAGARNAAAVGRAGWTALALALVFMSCAAVLFWTAPETLLSLFLDRSTPQAGEVLAIGTGLLAVAALFQLFDGAQVVGGNILRGLSDTRVPMMIAIAGYWGIGFPLAYSLGFPLGFGGQGIWVGLAAGLATVAIAAVWRFAWRERIGLVSAG